MGQKYDLQHPIRAELFAKEIDAVPNLISYIGKLKRQKQYFLSSPEKIVN